MNIPLRPISPVGCVDGVQFSLYMHRLSNMPEGSIHAGVLRDNIADAQEHPSYGNWAGGIIKQ